MKLFLKNNHILRRTLWLIIIIIFIGLVCFGLFVFEYKGFDKELRDRFPQLSFLSNLPKILDVFYLPYLIKSSPLPIYNLIIDPADLEKLEKDLSENPLDMISPRSPSDLLLSEYRKTIPVKFVYDNQIYKAKLRIHGDFGMHWRYEKKSWQIVFSDDNLFNGKKKINLILPEDRSFISEHLSNYRAKKMGLIVPESRFVILKINNSKYAVYFEIEAWTKEFLEKNQRADQANLYGEYDTLVFQGAPDLFNHLTYWKKYTQGQQNDIDDFADIDLLSQLIKNSSDEEFYQKIPNLLNMDNFYKWQAHSVLMGSTHQDFMHNVRLYFNPASGKFEFIPWDLRQFDRDEFIDLHYNTLVSRLLKNPEFLHQRNKVLWDYLKDNRNLEDDLNFYDQTYQEVKVAFYKDRIKEFCNFFFDRKIKNKRNLLINQYSHIQDTLENNKVLTVVRIFPQSVRIDITTQGFSDISLHLNPDSPLYYDRNQNQVFDRGDLLLLDYFQMYSQREIPQEPLFEAEIKVLPTDYSFFLDKSDFNLDDFELNLTNAVTGSSVKPFIRYVDQETFSYFEQINDSQESFLQRYHIFRKGLLANQVVLPRGIYNISENIIVPQAVSLLIEPAVQLKFAPDVSLVSYGPVEAKGTKSLPIVFTAQDKNKPWGVVGLVGQKTNKSEFEYCYFDYGSQAYINGVIFSGMLSAHYTDIDVKYCQFSQAEGDDGLNIKYSQNSKIEKNDFHHNQFDGLDLDYSNGQIKNNNFFANGNDGLDICGGRPLIVSNRIEKSSDKCISLGEETKAIVFNNLLLDCQTGIAVKDLAQPIIINNTIIDNQTGLALYQKKEVFGGGFPQVANTIIWHNQEQISLDEKSKIEISYSDIQGGYSGNNNLIQEPIFQNPEQGDYTLLDSQENLGLIKGGNSELIKTIFKEELPSIPMGIINNL